MIQKRRFSGTASYRSFSPAIQSAPAPPISSLGAPGSPDARAWAGVIHPAT